MQVGYCKVKQGKSDEAIRAYQQALELKPDSEEIHNKLGDAYYYAGKNDRRHRFLQSRGGLRPDNAEAHYNLAVAHFEIGNEERALRRSRHPPQTRSEALREVDQRNADQEAGAVAGAGSRSQTAVNGGSSDSIRFSTRRVREVAGGRSEAKTTGKLIKKQHPERVPEALNLAPFQGAFSFPLFPVVFASLRPPATILQPSRLLISCLLLLPPAYCFPSALPLPSFPVNTFRVDALRIAQAPQSECCACISAPRAARQPS